MIAWQSDAHKKQKRTGWTEKEKEAGGKKQVIAWQSAANEKREYTGGAETAEERMKRKSRKGFYV